MSATMQSSMNSSVGDSVLLAAMAVMFGAFLIGLWCEARRALGRVAAREGMALEASLQNWESDYRRQLARREARTRLESLRVAAVANQLVADEDEAMYEPAARAVGFERVGRILERLNAIDERLDNELEAVAAVPEARFGELNLVQGGARTPETGKPAATMPEAVPSTRSNARRSSGRRSNALRSNVTQAA